MAATTSEKGIPVAALAVAAYGAVLGSLFPIVVVLSVADVSGGLSVAADSGALVNTAQNVGSVAGILIAPSITMGVGRGRMMLFSGIGFLVASVACAVAPSLGWMLAARTVHGVFGGILPLMFMMIVMSSLRPGRGQFEGMTLFAGSTTLFFGMAASLGALLVDGLGWRALFWAQAVAVIPYIIAASRVLPGETGRPETLRDIDWANYLPLTAGLGMVVVALSEGERHFWLEAWWVPALCLGGAVLIAFAVHGLLTTRGRTLVVLDVFRRPTFAWGILLSIFFRFGTMFVIFIVPAFLGRLQGLRPSETGHVLMLMTPAAAVGLAAAWGLARLVDSRWLLSAGLAFFAAAAWQCVDIGPDWAIDQLRVATVIAGVGLALFSVGVLRFAVIGATMVDGPSVGIVFNLARVLGNVAGLAMLMHLVAEREKAHSSAVVEALTATNGETAQRLATTAGALSRFSADPAASEIGAFAALGRTATGQAFTLAFADALGVTAIVLALGAILVWALPRIPLEGAVTSQGSPS